MGAGVPLMYVNPLKRLPDCVSGLVTTTTTAPAVWEGVLHVIEVALPTETTVAGVPPKVTVTVPLVAKPVPVMVTEVEPVVGPEVGFTEETVGAGALAV